MPTLQLKSKQMPMDDAGVYTPEEHKAQAVRGLLSSSEVPGGHAVHTRLLVVVGAADWTWPGSQSGEMGMQTRSDVDVGAML